MGAIRFTWTDRNIVVAATSLPNAKDVTETNRSHYHETHRNVGIWGIEGVYLDAVQANEDIQIFVDMS